MKEGRLLEVKKQLELEKKECEKWKESKTDQVKFTFSFDIGWNKKSSGNRYNSLSSHVFMVDCNSQKIITMTITANSTVSTRHMK